MQIKISRQTFLKSNIMTLRKVFLLLNVYNIAKKCIFGRLFRNYTDLEVNAAFLVPFLQCHKFSPSYFILHGCDNAHVNNVENHRCTVR